MLVVRQDTVPAPEINDAIDALRAGKAEFLGCILNDMAHLTAYSAGYGYGYGYYGYGYGKKYDKYGYGHPLPARSSSEAHYGTYDPYQ